MELHVTKNQFDPRPCWTERIKTIFACPPKEAVELFDQNGYDLTRLEQMYAVANARYTTKHRDREHITLRQTWFQDSQPEDGAHINHAVMFERKGFDGEALEQLQSWAKAEPHLYKLINMKPKWGLDFSIDYCDREGNVFELLHWEYDGFKFDEIAEKKSVMEDLVKKQDWSDRAKVMLERKDEWHHLDFFAQSAWKTKFFGIEKERFKMVLWK